VSSASISGAPLFFIELFYREAGPEDANAVVLLHGFPTSSHMFRNLIPLLAEAVRRRHRQRRFAW
jgi:pimeloyl-ACP methyl ester carboxylesterase